MSAQVDTPGNEVGLAVQFNRFALPEVGTQLRFKIAKIIHLEPGPLGLAFSLR